MIAVNKRVQMECYILLKIYEEAGELAIHLKDQKSLLMILQMCDDPKLPLTSKAKLRKCPKEVVLEDAHSSKAPYNKKIKYIDSITFSRVFKKRKQLKSTSHSKRYEGRRNFYSRIYGVLYLTYLDTYAFFYYMCSL